MDYKIINLIFYLTISSAVNAGEWVNILPNKWKLSGNNWTSIEQKLKIKIEEIAINQDNPIQEWGSYNFQYRSELVDGKKLIHINGFCVPIDNWRTEWIYISDGGSCFFEAYYSPDSNSFVEIFVNGQA